MFSFTNVGVLALASASTAFAGYVLQDDYSGAGFFDNFDFVTVSSSLNFLEIH